MRVTPELFLRKLYSGGTINDGCDSVVHVVENQGF